VKGRVFLNRHDSSAAVSPEVRHENVLCQGNGILNVGGETRIYHGRWVNAEKLEDYHAEVALATLPRDRWGALGLVPHATEGSVWTNVMTLDKNCKLTLNAAGVGGMSVEVADEKFELLPKFSGAHAGTAGSTDGLDCPVQWAEAGLGALAGRAVRFRIHLRNRGPAEPRLFAAYVSCG
jgi:hypothetical protein